jgi:hypothetical protein
MSYKDECCIHTCSGRVTALAWLPACGTTQPIRVCAKCAAGFEARGLRVEWMEATSSNRLADQKP